MIISVEPIASGAKPACPSARINHRHARRYENEQEHADEFNEIFFHKSGTANFRPVNPSPPAFASEKNR
jgi:hypothetical protein